MTVGNYLEMIDKYANCQIFSMSGNKLLNICGLDCEIDTKYMKLFVQKCTGRLNSGKFTYNLYVNC